MLPGIFGRREVLEKPTSSKIPHNNQTDSKPLKRKLSFSPGGHHSEDEVEKKGTTPKRRRSLLQNEGSPSSIPGSHSGATPAKGARLNVPLSERQQLALLMQISAEESQTQQQANVTSPRPSSPHSTGKKTPLDKKVNKKNEKGETQLHLAAIRGDVKHTKQLIKAGADVNVKDHAGWTALHEACYHGHVDVAKALLKAGANVNVQGYDSDTPLHDASVNGHDTIVELLVRHGANPVQPNSRGKTPLDIAANENIVKLLKNEIYASSTSSESALSDIRSPTPPDSCVSEEEKTETETAGGKRKHDNTDSVFGTSRLPIAGPSGQHKVEAGGGSQQPPTTSHSSSIFRNVHVTHHMDKSSSPRLTLKFHAAKSKERTGESPKRIKTGDSQYKTYSVSLGMGPNQYDLDLEDKEELQYNQSQLNSSVSDSNTHPRDTTRDSSSDVTSYGTSKRVTKDTSVHSNHVSSTELSNSHKSFADRLKAETSPPSTNSNVTKETPATSQSNLFVTPPKDVKHDSNGPVREQKKFVKSESVVSSVSYIPHSSSSIVSTSRFHGLQATTKTSASVKTNVAGSSGDITSKPRPSSTTVNSSSHYTFSDKSSTSGGYTPSKSSHENKAEKSESMMDRSADKIPGPFDSLNQGPDKPKPDPLEKHTHLANLKAQETKYGNLEKLKAKESHQNISPKSSTSVSEKVSDTETKQTVKSSELEFSTSSSSPKSDKLFSALIKDESKDTSKSEPKQESVSPKLDCGKMETVKGLTVKVNRDKARLAERETSRSPKGSDNPIKEGKISPNADQRWSPKPFGKEIIVMKNPKVNLKPIDSNRASPKSDRSDRDSPKSDRDNGRSSPKVPPLKIIIPTKVSREETKDTHHHHTKTVSTKPLPYVLNPTQEGGVPMDTTENTQSVPSVSGSITSTGFNMMTDDKFKDENSMQGTPGKDDTAGGPTRKGYRLRNQNADKDSKDEEGDKGDMKEEGENGKGDKEEKETRGEPGERRLTRSQARTQGKNTDEKDIKEDTNSKNGDKASGSHKSDQSEEAIIVHPRKRKLRPPRNETSSSIEPSTFTPFPTVNPDKTINPIKHYIDIRNKVARRRDDMSVVVPKPPQNYNDYMLVTCNYILHGNQTSTLQVPTLTPPNSLDGTLKDLFVEQEKNRYKLRLQHMVEREKLRLTVEQEIIRVHGRAARAMANQSTPLSVCAILRDEDIYNPMAAEQDDKDKNIRSRFNGRLFCSWLQDVSDKYDKIKEQLLSRHHHEAESLQAVQKLEWEWKIKELSLCEQRSNPTIDDLQVPIVQVNDDFELLPS